jgi:hypothetical protein
MTIDPAMCRKDRALAISFLSSHLRNGTLALAIGAGVSKQLNLPCWFELVNRCSESVGLLPDLTDMSSNDELCQRMEVVEKKTSGGKCRSGAAQDYRNTVRNSLYKTVDYSKVLHSDLLIAIGALTMGSQRGNVTEIINFNFDDVLEWYLRLHGYQINPIRKLPALRTSADVTIYHPHGFLPYHEEAFKQSDFLIFSQYSYDEKMGNNIEPWNELTKGFLQSKLVMFIGLSGSDKTFGPIFSAVNKELKSSRPIGVWLCGPDMNKEVMDKLQDRNMICLPFEQFSQIPDYILEICQDAANTNEENN